MVIDLKQFFFILKSVQKVSKQAVTYILSLPLLSKKWMCGDANDCVDTLPWEGYIIQPLLAEYELKDIFNADETACFFKAMPSRTYAFVGENVTGGKQSKDRLTVLVCANMDGSKRLTPIVIGKVKSPTALKR